MQNTSANIGLVQIEPITYEVTLATSPTPLVPGTITVTKYRALPIATAFVIGAGELTSASTVASVAHTAHGFTSGQLVTISGCTQEEYNGTFVVKVTNANLFTYTFGGSATSPATSTTRMVANAVSDQGLRGNLELTFTAGHVKRWLRANMVIWVKAFGTTVALNQKYRVKSVDYTANTAILYAPFISDFSVYNTLTTEGATAEISVHAQRFVVRVPTGGATVTIGPNTQALSVPYGYQPTIAQTTEKEFIAPAGAKWDMADWVGTVAAATQVVQVYVV